MTSKLDLVKRYTDGGPDGWMQTPTGEFVLYEDYERLRAALEAHDGWLARTGHGADHPWRTHIARALRGESETGEAHGA